MSTARKTRPGSEPASLRQRAEVSRASASRLARGGAETSTASPDLLAMVAEWQENMRLQNDGNLSDEEAEPTSRRGDDLQRAVLTYPAKSVADLRAKLPVLRDELSNTSGLETAHGKEPLDHVAWVGVIRDIERITPVTVAPLAERCAAAQLGDLLEKAWVLRDECEGRVTPQTNEALSGLTDYTVRRIDDLKMGISFVRAISPAGMLAQIAVTAGTLELAVHGSTQAIREAAADQAERCLFSVAAALCAMTGVDREGFAAGRYLALSCDRLATASPEAAR